MIIKINYLHQYIGHSIKLIAMPAPGASRTGGLRTTSISQASRIRSAPPAVRLKGQLDRPVVACNKLTKKTAMPAND